MNKQTTATAPSARTTVDEMTDRITTASLDRLIAAPSAEQRGDATTTTPNPSPLAGLHVVLALVEGGLVATVCPKRFCKENHTGENTGHLEDVGHAGAHVDVYVPHFQTGDDELFAYACLDQVPYSSNPQERAAFIRVEDDEEHLLTPDQADRFADSLTVFADRIRALAQVARTTDEAVTP